MLKKETNLKREKISHTKMVRPPVRELSYSLYKYIKVTKEIELEKEESQDNKQIKTKKRNIPGSEAERESTHVGPIFEMVISQHHAI